MPIPHVADPPALATSNGKKQIAHTATVIQNTYTMRRIDRNSNECNFTHVVTVRKIIGQVIPH